MSSEQAFPGSLDPVRRVLSHLPQDSPVAVALLAILSTETALLATDPVTAALGAGATAVTALAGWVSRGQAKEYELRLEQALRMLVRRVEELDAQRNTAAKCDDEWAELVVNVLPLAVRTRAERKRALFAALLAESAYRADPGDRDFARTMALILDQLELVHVALLDRIMNAPATQNYSGVWGVERSVPDIALKQGEGAAILRMESLGLMRHIENKKGGALVFEILVSDIGASLHRWITGTAA
jgi:hypothetical protein